MSLKNHIIRVFGLLNERAEYAVFYLHWGNVVMCAWLALKSVWYRPGYWWEKVRHNLVK